MIITACQAFTLAIGILATAPTESPAQASPPQTTVVWADPTVATLMLVDVLPAPAAADARAVLIRRPGDPPNNIILVTTATAPRELSAAVTALAFSRRSQGDQVDREMRTVIRASADSLKARTADDRRADRDLRRVRLAPPGTIASIGVLGPAITVRMSDSAVTSGRAAAPQPVPPPNRMKRDER